ncbi:MAG: sigma factor-like helix-turn-helix DNA-binding protein [Lachnospiraceae bacterium]
MAKLKTEYREALYLVSLEGMSYREAGKILEEPNRRLRIWDIEEKKV